MCLLQKQVTAGGSEKQERRSGCRHLLYLSAEILIDGRISHNAITKDISENGLLLLTRARLVTEQALVLDVHLPHPSQRKLRVSGRVVRREPLTEEEKGAWREKVGVRFDQPQAELAHEFAQLAREQARLYDWD